MPNQAIFQCRLLMMMSIAPYVNISVYNTTLNLPAWFNTSTLLSRSLTFIVQYNTTSSFAGEKIVLEKTKQTKNKNKINKSSGVSHSDGSCVLGRIHSDVSSNIPKKVYHIVTDNFVNLLHISYAWLYKTECWGRKFHAFSFNSHRNCKIFITNFNFIFDSICVPYIFRKSIFGWNCDHDTPLCDTPLLEDTPLCDTPDKINR